MSSHRSSAERAQLSLRHAVPRIAAKWPTLPANSALSTALFTPSSPTPAEVRNRSDALLPGQREHPHAL